MRRNSDSTDDGPNYFDLVTENKPGSPTHHTAVLRDSAGAVAYPGFVPPYPEAPISPAPGPSGSSVTNNVNGVSPAYQDGNDSDSSSSSSVSTVDENEEDVETDDILGPPPRASTMPVTLGRAQSATSRRRAPTVPTLDRAQTLIFDHERHAAPSVDRYMPGSPVRRNTPPARPIPSQDWQTERNKRPARRPQAPRAGQSHLNTAIWQREDEYESSSSSDEDEECVPAADSVAQAQLDRQKSRDGTDPQAPGGRNDAHLGGADADSRYRRFLVGNNNYSSKGKIKKDGRLRITVDERAGTGYIAKALGAAISKMKKPGRDQPGGEASTRVSSQTGHKLSPVSSFTTEDIEPRPKLNIVIMVIGSRGDVQPFLKIGRVLKDYGHRVRIATHPTFRDYVERDSGLEFFSVGGDPSELMAFMVKNPGMIPTLETVRAGDIGKRRAAMAEMFDGFWRACINATDDEKDRQNLKMMGSKDPFVADAIIANPPSFAHIHCAEALGIPLHLMFTFPYTPTQAFPHPLASIKKSNVDPGYTNFISYPMVEMMIWQGLGDLVNAFRVKTLSLDPVSTLWAPGATYRMHVPFTYLWSPGIVPKPRDWGEEIDVSGFVYLDLASSFTPPTDLEAFLAAGEMPIYIGFGSIVVDDADRFTEMIFKAVEKAGVRALISRGWGGLGSKNTPDNVFMLENTPHDWLFPRIKACVIHGGAGTTAIALKLGRPTMVVPFFGDQHFWGKMVWNSGVGPEPIPYKHLNADNLAEGIKYCLTEEAREAARKIAKSIEAEGDGAVNAVREFHRHLNLRGKETMRCSLLRDQIATWQPKGTKVKLSPLAADILVDAGLIKWSRLRLIRHKEWNDFEGPGEPVTGIAGSITHTVSKSFKGVGGVPIKAARTAKRYKKRLSTRKEQRKSLEANGVDRGLADDVEVANVQQNITTPDLDDALGAFRTTTQDIHDEFVGDLATGVGMTASAIAMAPVDLSLALAQGFHNAPRLYGDDTVRKPIRITGIRSGLRAARKEFVYGVYDGFTGVVLLPIRGAKADGVVGFVKGTGMGLLGLVVKNLAAIIGPFGYALKGMVKQVQRRKNPSKFIRRARIAQGQRAVLNLSDRELKMDEQRVVQGYHVMHGLCEAISAALRNRGLAGQFDRLFMDTGVLFEDLETANTALKALKRGESLEDVIRRVTDNGGSQRNSGERKEKEKEKGSGKARRRSTRSPLGAKSLRWKRDKEQGEKGIDAGTFA